jgi:hypothetical protein
MRKESRAERQESYLFLGELQNWKGLGRGTMHHNRLNFHKEAMKKTEYWGFGEDFSAPRVWNEHASRLRRAKAML